MTVLTAELTLPRCSDTSTSLENTLRADVGPTISVSKPLGKSPELWANRFTDSGIGSGGSVWTPTE